MLSFVCLSEARVEEDAGDDCGMTSYRCIDGSGCIPWSKFCDFYGDCHDASDETICGIYESIQYVTS